MHRAPTPDHVIVSCYRFVARSRLEGDPTITILFGQLNLQPRSHILDHDIQQRAIGILSNQLPLSIEDED